ncbi:MAG TPA: ABC transporter ATP-binding protein [Acidimicrobiales bacterium]|nr:ABC transporter ATP-binding protein [Acidimicrobiales bacterium]
MKGADAGQPPRRTVKARDLLSLLAPNRLLVAVSTVLVLLAAGLGLLQPIVAGRVIEAVSAAEPVGGIIWTLVLLFLGQVVIDTLGRYMLERTGEGVVFSLRTKLIHHLLRIRIECFDQCRTGDLVSRVTTDAGTLRETVTRGLVDVAVGAVAVTGATILMISIDIVIFLVVLGVFAVAAAGVGLVLGRIRVAAERVQTSVGSLSADLDRALSAIRTIRAGRAEGREAQRLIEGAGRAHADGVESARLIAIASPAVQLAATGSFLLVLLVGGSRVASDQLELGALISLLLYAMYLVVPLGNLLEGVTVLKRALGAFQRAADALDLPLEPLSSEEHTPTPRLGAPALCLRDVHFSYDGRPVLRGVDLEVPTGARVAIVGPSGAGKSTILGLVCQFYEPQSGEIEVVGLSVEKVGRDRVRELIALVEQDAPVIHGTLRDNLTLAAPKASEDELHQVLRQVHLSGLLARLPAGLDSAVGERGILLSGGERQRLAIARALLTHAPLLLLDEPTASLDGRSEGVVLATIDELPREQAVLVVAHRLSTVRSADRIVVLESGRVAASGRHDELIAASELYRDLVTQQLKQGDLL